MNNNENYISYKGTGEILFDCPLVLENSSNLQVFVDGVFFSEHIDYIIKDFAKQTQKVEFKKAMGTASNPKTIIFRRVLNIKRTTDFFNVTQIKGDLLNKEFNNLVQHQKFLQENLMKTISQASSNNPIFLPNSDHGKALLWDRNGEIINSERNINYSLNVLWNFMEKLSANANNGTIGGGGGNSNTPIYSADVLYNKNSLPAKNVEEALHSLKNPKNIYYTNPNMDNVFNLEEAINYVANAKGINYNNTVSNLPNSSNVQNAIEALSKEVNALKNSINTVKEPPFIAIPHSILDGILNASGIPSHISYLSTNTIEVVGTEQAPLKIVFSHNNNITLGILKEKIALTLPTNANKTFYIYADLLPNNQITIGYKENIPYYVSYKVASVSNFIIDMDRWKSPADYFHIPTLSMFDYNHNLLKRVYIGQVRVHNGAIVYINSYTHGNSFTKEVTNNDVNNMVSFPNHFGCQNITMDIYYKNNSGDYNEFFNYSTNTNLVKDDNTMALKHGNVWNVSAESINIRFGLNSSKPVHYHYFNNPQAPGFSNGGGYRIIVRRMF